MRASAISDLTARPAPGGRAGLSGWRAWAPTGPRARRLSLGALGLGLTLLFAIAWGSSFLYLIVQLEIPVAVSLILADAIHIWVGIVAIVFLSGKLWRVGHRSKVPGVPRLLLWQRWISMSLAVLSIAVLVTGVLLLLPLRGAALGDLVEIHLLTAVWALPLTIWHAWHYRRRTLPHLPGSHRSRAAAASLVALAVILLPMTAAIAVPRALSPLSQVGAGSPWEQAGLPGSPVEQVVAAPRGNLLVRTSRGVYLGAPDRPWHRIPVIQGEDVSYLSLARTGAGGILVGTGYGLYRAARSGGPYAAVYFPDGLVDELARDPGTDVLWAAGSEGVATSDDGGMSWQDASVGLPVRAPLGAIAIAGGSPYVATAGTLYRWRWSDERWVVSGAMPGVRTLAYTGDRLYAIAPGHGAWVLKGRRWTKMPALSPLFAPEAGAHQTSMVGMGGMSGAAMAGLPEGRGQVAAIAGRLYAVGTTDRVSVSADSGRTWSAVAGGLPTGETVNEVEALPGGRLLAATDDGVFVTTPAQAPAAGAAWWVAIAVLALAAGGVAILVGARWRGASRRSP